ncbi:MAG: type IV secretion system DNA-binding domain-containing protein [Bacteroidetes bacterium]|nr:type IV secretion system DNA-binding domain-containing protein [Bacteroidota bacterium]
MLMTDITPIGITTWRNEHKPFGIKDKDRCGHIYCIGKTGVGKSTLLLNMAISDIDRGNGLCIIDPHGDLAETILNYIPPERLEDVIYFNPADLEYPIGFNPIKAVHPTQHHLACSALIATFKKIWLDSWGPRLEYILRHCILSLLEYPHATLLDIQPLLTNPEFRYKVLGFVTNSHTRSFWEAEYDKYPPAFRAEAISPILNKVGVFAASDILRNIIGQRTNSFHMQQVLDSKKILICNFSKGLLGEDISILLGSMLVTSIQLASLARAGQPEEERVPFYLYVDEMHSFISVSFADMLAEARKFKLSLFLTHQYIDQLQEDIKTAIFGNVGTLITFRVGATDAEFLSKEFYPPFTDADLTSLPRYCMYIKLLIDGATSAPFSAKTHAPKENLSNKKEEHIARSKQMWGRNKDIVEADIAKRMQHSSATEKTNTLFN